jgi:hypothetical protein
MSIREFAQQYVAKGYPHDPRLMRRVYLTDISTSTLVWDEGEYLVELYFMHPLAVVVPHSHPFENLSVHYTGKIFGQRKGVIGRWLTDKDHGCFGIPLAPGDWHSFQVGDTGAVFYNISRWDDCSLKDSATVKYLGEPLGPLHRETLQRSTQNLRSEP